MASTYETEEPQAPEPQTPEPERSPIGPLLLLAADEPLGRCDLGEECR